MDTASVIDLPSGAKLRVQVAPFAVSKALYQAMLKELKGLQFSQDTDMTVVFKDLFCVGFSSQEIEARLWKCFERCTVDGSKIDADTFEPIDRRDDYIKVCSEVARANIFPFMKSLYAEFEASMALTEENRASSPKTTT